MEVLHELRHFHDWETMGYAAYKRLGSGLSDAMIRLRKEQDVYDALRDSRHWRMFTEFERQAAQRQIKNLGGIAW